MAHELGYVKLPNEARSRGYKTFSFSTQLSMTLPLLIKIRKNNYLSCFGLKTYAAISNAHLSRVWKRVKLSGSCLSTITDSDQHSFPILLYNIGVSTFS